MHRKCTYLAQCPSRQQWVWTKTLPSFGGSIHASVVGWRLGFLGHFLLCARLLDTAVVEASVHKALGRLKLEVLPGAHQGRVVDQGVEELPAPAGSLGARHFGLLLLLLDQLDPWGRVRHSDSTSGMQQLQAQRTRNRTADISGCDWRVFFWGSIVERVIIAGNHIVILQAL